MNRVLVLGAGGILGQHMMQGLRGHYDKTHGLVGNDHTDLIPHDTEAMFCKRTEAPKFHGVDMTDYDDLRKTLYDWKPDVVVNLAGENRVDVVEQEPDRYYPINVDAVEWLAAMCDDLGAHLVQGSTQGVFSGINPPYSPDSQPDPITQYGLQKWEAEKIALSYPNSTVARITFVLGVRPFKEMGRQNPLEQMFEKQEQVQVDDRWFSPAFADDAAMQLWKIARVKPGGIVHIGQPIRMTRYGVALSVYHDTYGSMHDMKLTAASHEDFPGIAPRPLDTTWAHGSWYHLSYENNINNALNQWKKREDEFRNKI